MDNIIDFKSMVAKLQHLDPTPLNDIKKQIISEMKNPTPVAPKDIETPLSDLRELAGLPTPEMSKKSIKKVRKTVDKMKDSPDAKKSIGNWAKGKFKNAKSAMFAIATNQQKAKESKSHIGRALIDKPTTMSGKIEEAVREANYVVEESKFQGKFEKGDGIRAYDHQPIEGRPDKYIEGEIITVDAESESQPGSIGYHVKVDKDTLFTKDGGRVGKTVFVPYEISMDYDERISKVDAHLDHMNVPGREYRPDDEDEARAWARSNEATGTFIGGHQGTADFEPDDEDRDNPDTEYGEYWHKAREDVKNLNKLGLTGLIAELYEKLDQAGAYNKDMKLHSYSEGKMSDIDLDMKELKDQEFLKKHGKTKEEMKKSLGEQEPEAPMDQSKVSQRANQLRRFTGQQSQGQMVAKGMEKLGQGKQLPPNLIKHLAPYAQSLTKILTDPQLFQKFRILLQQANKTTVQTADKDTPKEQDVPKDHEYGPSSDKAPAGKRGYKSSPGARTAHLKTVKKYGKKKRRQGDKISIEAKNKLLDIGKAIREKAQEQGIQPAAFLGYLVAKDPKKYGSLAKLESIINGKS